MFVLMVLCLVGSTLALQLSPGLCPVNQQDNDTLSLLQVPEQNCTCNAQAAGTLRYQNNMIQYCDGESYVGLQVSVVPTYGSEQNPAESCSEILERNSEAESGVYYLKPGISVIKAYCYMEEICGSKGWTMIMKIDGFKTTFTYRSSYWSNKQPYHVVGADGGLDNTEVKLDTYSHSPFSKLCLGLKTAGVTKWMRLEYRASSLYSLIADGKYRATYNGRDAWKNLIAGSSLQRNCNREGFNAKPWINWETPTKARIGIVSNQENDCRTPDSRIGFGTEGNNCGQNTLNSAGNEARCSPDNGSKSIKSFGYIFSQEELQNAPTGSFDNPGSSCKDIKSARVDAANGVYYLDQNDQVTRVYCHMDTICNSSGWTLLLKMDGTKQTFKFDSNYWTSDTVYNIQAVSQGLTTNEEVKLSTYSTFPFTKLCLGMKVGSSTRWLELSKTATSLHSVIAGNQFMATNLGRDAWKSLISGSSLQRNCNREGFNVQLSIMKARIGILANEQNHCRSPDSYLGFGIKTHHHCGLRSYSAGNGAGCRADNGNRNTPAMGFILSQ